MSGKPKMVRRRTGGYTIVEAMIFLAVSGGLLLTTMGLFRGQDQRTRFTQSVVALNQELQDLLNDVSTGFYPSNSDFRCQEDIPGGTVTFPAGPSVEQGKNTGCSFMGKIMILPLNTKNYSIYTVVGRQNADTIAAAGPKLLLGNVSNPGVVDTKNLQGGLEVTKLVDPTGTVASMQGIAIISELATRSATDNSLSGNAAHVSLRAYTGDLTSGKKVLADFPDLAQGLIVCLQESGGGRKAALIIGGSGQLSIERKLDNDVPGGC